MPNTTKGSFFGIGAYIVAKIQKKYGIYITCDGIFFDWRVVCGVSLLRIVVILDLLMSYRLKVLKS